MAMVPVKRRKRRPRSDFCPGGIPGPAPSGAFSGVTLHRSGARRQSGTLRPMRDFLQGIPPLFLLVVATTLEACGDAVVRLALGSHAGSGRTALWLLGAALLLGYGTFLNLAPLEFGRVVGLYIGTLFVVWQVVNYAFFRTLPTLPILVGGVLIVAGGVIVTYWRPG